jgi:crossover junction endodeoxyribonuclease RuvC
MSGWYCGIDPGLSGAVAFIGEGGISVFDMPTLKAGTKRTIDEVELARIIDDATKLNHIEAVALEQVGTRPGEGAVGAFTFGRGYGLIRGILRAHFVPIVDVTPARWKRDIGIKSGAGKDASRALAKERFQRNAHLFARVRDDGRAEAALLALWCSQQSTIREEA